MAHNGGGMGAKNLSLHTSYSTAQNSDVRTTNRRSCLMFNKTVMNIKTCYGLSRSAIP